MKVSTFVIILQIFDSFVDGEVLNDIMLDTIEQFSIKCTTVIQEDIRVSNSKVMIKKAKHQIKFIKESHKNMLSNLLLSENCGIFVKIESKNLLKKFIENVQEENIQLKRKDIFKVHLWFILTERPDSMELLFRFDSQVYLIQSGSHTVYETYSIGGATLVTSLVGQWTRDGGLGRMRNTFTNVSLIILMEFIWQLEKEHKLYFFVEKHTITIISYLSVLFCQC